ncbi:MAG: stage III sporulation protein AA [Bacillaceae bacterium]
MNIPIEVQRILPTTMHTYLNDIVEPLEEIRVRIGRSLECIGNSKAMLLSYTVTERDGAFLLNQLSQYSLYTLEEELKRGFVTIVGGHRIGLAGKVVTDKGSVKMIRDITSYNIRIATERVGIANQYLPYLFQAGWQNTLIIGAPQTGKTTLIRDIARMVSEGIDRKYPSAKVGIVDERSEITGSVKGIPTFHLGQRVDVLDACPKAEGMMMMIRSMSPEVLIVDEIGRSEDTVAIMEAIHSGVTVIATAHGHELEDIKKRPALYELFQQEAFKRIIILSRRDGPGMVTVIYNHNQQVLYGKEPTLRC